MKTSLIITTYNWKEALSTVLNSVLTQIELPNEVIIADDGSRQDTIDMIAEFQRRFPIPLIHSWQEDKGFRAAKSRNKAIAKASHEYIIIIDGDIVLPPTFILDHKKLAKQGQFIQGGRALFNHELTKQVMQTNQLPNLFTAGIKNRKNMINNAFLSSIFSHISNTDKSTRSCNMSFWLSDCLEINGFNNQFIGWGREDSDFVLRMLNLGKDRLYLKFSGVGYHLYHNENSRASLSENDAILERTIQEKLTRCEQGIDQHLKENND